MKYVNQRIVLSVLIAAAGCVVGGYSAFAAFANGMMIANGVPGTLFGLAFAAVVIVSWLMLPLAEMSAMEGARRSAWLWRGAWLIALGFVLANSIAFSAHYQVEATGAKGLQIDAYERAQRAEALAAAELNTLVKNPRFEATGGCSFATAAKSKVFCEHMRDAQTRVQAAQTILAIGRPAAKDPGVQTLAWVLGGDEAKVGRSLPVFWAVVLELMASLCIKNAFTSSRRPDGTRQKADISEVEAFNGVEPNLNAAPFKLFELFPKGEHLKTTGFRLSAFNDNIPAGHAA